MENRQRGPLPYARGGFPGSLVILTGIEAVSTVISAVLTLIGLFTARQFNLSVILALVMMAVNVILAVNLFRGLYRIRRGVSGGAALAEGACKGHRILLWLVFAGEIIIQFIGLINVSRYGSAGTGFLALLLTDAILLAILLPFIFYYKDAELILQNVGMEEGGTAMQTFGVGHFSGLCCTFAGLLAVVLILCETAVIDIRSSIRSLYYFDSDIISFFDTIIPLLLVFAIARFLIVNMCYRGYLRSHQGVSKEDTVLRPSGLRVFPTVCVLGSVCLGCLFAEEAGMLITYIRRGADTAPILLVLVLTAAFLLLSIALMNRPGRPGRSLAAAIGSALGAGAYVYMMIRRFSNGWTISDFQGFTLTAGNVMTVVFFVLVFISALTAMNRPATDSWTLLVRIAGIAAVAFNTLNSFVAAANRGSETMVLSFLLTLIDAVILLTAFLGLARTFNVDPEEDESRLKTA